MAARIRALPGAAAAAAGEAVARHFAADARLAGGARVALYAALPDELPTRPLFEALRAVGTPLLLPRSAAQRRLEFAPVERWDELRPGRYGILEPPAGRPTTEPRAGDVVALPGRAFDRRGHRLGRGRGYYDRRFAGGGAAPLVVLVGLGYDFQLVDAVPHDEDDRDVDALVTESGVHWLGRG